MWTMQPRPLIASIDAVAPAALLVDKFGGASEVRSSGGRYQIPLAPATANSNETDPEDYVVGGDPTILVERPDGDLARAYRPLGIAPRPAPTARVPADRAWVPLEAMVPTPRVTAQPSEERSAAAVTFLIPLSLAHGGEG